MGGVNGTSNFAFKNSSDPLSVAQLSYTYRSHRTVPIAKRFEWVPGSRFSEEAPWPPLGLGLEVQFEPPSADLPSVNITYEMYQGLPVMSKKVTLGAATSGCHRVRGLMVERLAMQETHLGRNNHFDTDCKLPRYRWDVDSSQDGSDIVVVRWHRDTGVPGDAPLEGLGADMTENGCGYVQWNVRACTQPDLLQPPLIMP